MNNYLCFKYEQPYKNKKNNTVESQIYLSTVMKVSDICNYSKVLYYGEDDYGYQRKIEENHLKKLVNAISKNELVSPTSILLGIRKSLFENIYSEKRYENQSFIELHLESNKDVAFTIIDGQHRIEAFKALINKGSVQFNDYSLNVIIMVIDDCNRRVEVEAFNDINSKAKRLKTDLTMLAILNIKQLERDEDFNIFESLGKKICHKLKENQGNVWENAIFFPNDPKGYGIVGYKTFYESIKNICKNYSEHINMQFRDINKTEIEANQLIDTLIIPCWRIVQNKWPDCFKKEKIYIQDTVAERYYREDCYLQKAIGVKAINSIIAEYYTNSKYDFEHTLKMFDDKISKCSLQESDWMKGSTFNGLSSEAGFKVVKEIILKS